MLGSFTDQDWLNNFQISKQTFSTYVTNYLQGYKDKVP